MRTSASSRAWDDWISFDAEDEDERVTRCRSRAFVVSKSTRDDGGTKVTIVIIQNYDLARARMSWIFFFLHEVDTDHDYVFSFVVNA